MNRTYSSIPSQSFPVLLLSVSSRYSHFPGCQERDGLMGQYVIKGKIKPIGTETQCACALRQAIKAQWQFSQRLHLSPHWVRHGASCHNSPPRSQLCSRTEAQQHPGVFHSEPNVQELQKWNASLFISLPKSCHFLGTLNLSQRKKTPPLPV